MNQFTPVSFYWDPKCLSDHLEFDRPEDFVSEGRHELVGSRVCRVTTSLHSFKSAFGDLPLEPNNRYYFEVKCLSGNNFKIGICEVEALRDPNVAFSDTEKGFSYYSNG